MKNVALVVAIVLGIVAAIGVRSYLKRQETKVEERLKQVRVPVAGRSIRKGDAFTVDMVRFTEMPAESLTSDSITEADLRGYFGRQVWRNVDRGTILQRSFFIERMQEPASGVLAEGERAVTIPVDITTGVGGLLRPGDRIDLLATMTEAKGQAVGSVDTTKTWRVLSDVTILAVDNRLSPEVGGPQGAKASYATITLAVTPDEAEILVWLRGRAQLTCLMRPRFETGEPGAPTVVDIKNVESLAAKANSLRQDRLKKKKRELVAPLPEE